MMAPLNPGFILPETDLMERPLEQAETIPSAWYTHPDLHAWDLNAVMSHTWQMVASLQQLASPGDYVVATSAQNPVIIVRDKDNQLRAFYNVCRHRGGPLAKENGHGNVFRCRYHGWSYDLAGKLIGTPEFEGVQNFNPDEFGLKPLQVDTWEGLVFIALSKDVPPLVEVMAGIAQRIEPIKLADLRFTTRMSYDLACNWKVYVDNYLEGYHLNAVHPELSELLDYKNYVTETGQYSSLQYSPLRSENNFYSQGNGQAFYYFVYPNLMLNIMPGRLQTNLIIPVSHNRTKVVFDYYYAADEENVDQLIKEDLAYSEVIQQQDIEICELVQQGLESQGYDRGRFSVRREAGVHHFQNLIRRAYRQELERGDISETSPDMPTSCTSC